jgi:hypothetical protein
MRGFFRSKRIESKKRFSLKKLSLLFTAKTLAIGVGLIGLGIMLGNIVGRLSTEHEDALKYQIRRDEDHQYKYVKIIAPMINTRNISIKRSMGMITLHGHMFSQRPQSFSIPREVDLESMAILTKDKELVVRFVKLAGLRHRLRN